MPAAKMEEEAAAAAVKKEESLSAPQPIVLENIAVYVMNLWQRAKDAKRIHEEQFLANLRARNGQYDPAKLAAMQQMFGADYEALWMNITATKCRTAESWIRETLFQAGERPFGGTPTPIPELPPEIRQMAEEEVTKKVMDMAVQEAMMSPPATMPGMDGMPVQLQPQVDMNAVAQKVQMAMQDLDEQIMYEIKEKAKEAAEKMIEKIDDQFLEGNWYEALDAAIYDIVTFGTMIMKGPLFKRTPTIDRSMNPATGKWESSFKEDIYPYWERRSPFNIYPSPDATSIEDGYIFDRLQMTRKSLSDLKGVPGYDPDEISAALQEYRDGGLRDWLSVDSSKASAEGRDSSSLLNSETIECLEFHGTVPGSLLIGWGMKLKDIPDPEREYDTVLWQIGKHVIKAMLNPDPLRRKYFFRAGFEENPDMFFGKGVPQLLRSVQQLANSSARAIAHNVAIAAGPQVEINMDRLAPGENASLYPWKVWKTTNQGMTEGRAVEFYQPNPVTQRLLEVFRFCMDMADEDSGVPRYMQGNAQGVAGAGDTASGLNMLMTHAAKGVRSVIRNIDNGVIEPSVYQIYQYNMQYDKDIDIIGDVKFIAKGSSALVEKGQMAQRRTEILNTTANPFDIGIIGAKGRKELIKQNLISVGIDPEEVLDDAPDDPEEMMQQQMMGGAPAPASGLGGSPRGMGQVQAPPPKPGMQAADGQPMGGQRAPEFQSRPGMRP